MIYERTLRNTQVYGCKYYGAEVQPKIEYQQNNNLSLLYLFVTFFCYTKVHIRPVVEKTTILAQSNILFHQVSCLKIHAKKHGHQTFKCVALSQHDDRNLGPCMTWHTITYCGMNIYKIRKRTFFFFAFLPYHPSIPRLLDKLLLISNTQQ